ncbi:MAG: MlaD family protein [Methylococcales bacterium]|nr:MlaD family protein [Methylococcales bacterium]
MGKDKHALITGLFLIVFVVAVTAIIYWIGHFERERNVYVISTRESVSGLNPESTVFYRGIAVGKVIKILFDPRDSGIILIPIEVDRNITFTKGVYATLRLKGVTGLTQIQLEDSGTIPAFLPPGDKPMFRIPLVPSLTDKLMNSGEELLHKADHLMVRLSSLLNDENEKNIGDILANLKTSTGKLSDLQKSVDKALAGIPALTTDTQKTLVHINALTRDLQSLTTEVKTLGIKAGNLVNTGETAGDLLLQTTLPKINKLLTELRSTAQQVKRTATMLDNNPQALLLGPDQHDSGPGEPGYKEPK